MTRASSVAFPKVRLVGEDTNEVLTIELALKLAYDQGLDLILVSDKSDPPVVKIQDYKKLLYEKKKEKQKQRQSHQPEVKEIQLKPNITDHDLGTKINAMKRFLQRGDKVKLSLRLKGRERELMQDKVEVLVQKVIDALGCKASSAGPGIIILENAA